MNKESTQSAAQHLKIQQLSKKGRAVYEYQGVSMNPFFQLGDQITVQSYRDSFPQIGDVVMFLRNGQLILHRLIKIKKHPQEKKWLYITKGDNCRFADSPIIETAILGKALMIHRGKKNIRLDSGNLYFFQKLIAAFSLAELRAFGSLNRIKSLFRGV